MIRIFYISFLLFIHTALQAAPAIPSMELPVRQQIIYRHPSERFLDFHGKDLVLQTLRDKGLSLEHRNFFEHIVPHEEFGFFGYHSSTQAFRIYQDIIKGVIEEVCGLELKKDFHFLRIPGTPPLSRNSALHFLQSYPHVNDNFPEQRDQLLSVNFTLFGNFNHFGECSVAYFTKNMSIASIGFQNALKLLFGLVGLPEDQIPSLFAIGQPLLTGDNAILFQFFDLSHHHPYFEPYQFVNRMCYSCVPMGAPHPIGIPMSEVFLGDSSQPFPAQMRLLINNTHTLNPYSPLTIKRYDRVDPKVVLEYEKQLRAAIQKLPYDQQKATAYREMLLSFWRSHEY